MGGRKHSEETKEKIRQAHIGKPKSPEHCAKLKSVIHTAEWNEKVSRAKLGKPRLGIPADMRGEKNPMFGRRHSEESLQKMRGPRK